MKSYAIFGGEGQKFICICTGGMSGVFVYFQGKGRWIKWLNIFRRERFSWGGGDPQDGTNQLLPRIPKSYYSQFIIFPIVEHK